MRAEEQILPGEMPTQQAGPCPSVLRDKDYASSQHELRPASDSTIPAIMNFTDQG
jgi:hypothetical protein